MSGTLVFRLIDFAGNIALPTTGLTTWTAVPSIDCQCSWIGAAEISNDEKTALDLQFEIDLGFLHVGDQYGFRLRDTTNGVTLAQFSPTATFKRTTPVGPFTIPAGDAVFEYQYWLTGHASRLYAARATFVVAT